MCGRYASTRPATELAALFDAEIVTPPLPPSYNVAPTAQVYAVARARRGRRLGTMSWGLVPSWSAGAATGPRPINARAETLLDKALFAEALRRRRCLLPADGFYEWRQSAEGRHPYFISARDRGPLALAGLWDRWAGAEGTSLVSCAIVTTVANDVVAPLHDRMPVILPPEAWDAWLEPTDDEKALLGLLRPAPEGLLVSRPVSRLVNSVANDGPELLARAGSTGS